MLKHPPVVAGMVEAEEVHKGSMEAHKDQLDHSMNKTRAGYIAGLVIRSEDVVQEEAGSGEGMEDLCSGGSSKLKHRSLDQEDRLENPKIEASREVAVV